ncbi:MAG: type restriction enzyme subunit [Candidatus Cloacimonadota bacterium]|nr:type restriction enzyme subunit [Candidatus Cloacimonadota bacterium]
MKPYPKYKDSGIEWLGEVPEEWSILRSDSVINYVRNQIDPETIESDTVFHYSIPIVQESGTGQSEPTDELGSAKQLITLKSVLVSKLNPHKATICIAEPQDEVTICSSEFIAIAMQAKKCDITFLFYLSNSEMNRQRLDARVQSVTRSHQRVYPSDIYKFWLALPPKFEQKAIATFLDRETARIDALIQKKERMIELLKEKRIALITRAVTKGLDPNVPMKDSGIEWLGEVPKHWEVNRIKYIASRIQTGCTPPTSNEKYYEDGTIQWFGPSSFTDDLYLTDPVKMINDISITDGVARLFEKGSIMIVGIGATIGKIAQNTMPSSCNQQITVITLKRSKCYPDYYTYLLKTMENTIRGIAPSATLAIFDQGEIGCLLVLLPPLHEQMQVADFLSGQLRELTYMISAICSSIDLLREYRSSIINHAVTGKIDLRDYDAQAQ